MSGKGRLKLNKCLLYLNSTHLSHSSIFFICLLYVPYKTSFEEATQKVQKTLPYEEKDALAGRLLHLHFHQSTTQTWHWTYFKGCALSASFVCLLIPQKLWNICKEETSNQTRTNRHEMKLRAGKRITHRQAINACILSS